MRRHLSVLFLAAACAATAGADDLVVASGESLTVTDADMASCRRRRHADVQRRRRRRPHLPVHEQGHHGEDGQGARNLGILVSNGQLRLVSKGTILVVR